MAYTIGSSFKMRSPPSWSFGLPREGPDSDDEDDIDKLDHQAPTNVGQSCFDKHSQDQDVDTPETSQPEVQTAGPEAAHQGDNILMDGIPDPLVARHQSDSNHHENELDDVCSQREGMEFPLGFSDDDDDDNTHSFTGQSCKFAAPPKTRDVQRKKSPRSDDDIEPEGNPRPKRTRDSLFGNGKVDDDFLGPIANQPEEAKDSSNSGPQTSDDMELHNELDNYMASDELPEDHSRHLDKPPTPRGSLRNGMSTLTLEQAHGYEFGESSPRSNGFALTPEDADAEGSTSDCSEDFNLDRGPNGVYDLRTNIDRENIGHNGSWVDKDRSGDYDPEEEARKEKAARARAKAKGRKKKGKQPKVKKVVQPKLIVRLPFGDHMGTVLNIMDNEENWPDGWSDVDSEEEREREKRAQERASRPRPPPPIDQTPILDPAGIVDDLTGYPAARGCKFCRLIHSDPSDRDQEPTCSAISKGVFPCDFCYELGADCEPVITPQIKLKCNHCAEDCEEDEENVCSFEMASIGAQDICSQCAQQGHLDCVGRIPDGYKAPRIDLDEILYGPARPHVHCTNCRLMKKRCSVKSLDVKGPCKQCKKGNVACIFYDPPTQPTAPKKEKKKAKPAEAGPSRPDSRTDRPSSPLTQLMEDFFGPDDALDEEIKPPRSPTPEIIMEDANGNRGVYVEIFTSFAHPIRFNEDDQSACHFCNFAMYGFIGDLERKCHALQWLNGAGYTELQGDDDDHDGRKKKKKTPTVMCSSCTTSRAQIITCLHDIQRFVQGPPDFERSLEDLLQAAAGSEELAEQLRLWCSFCFAPALFKCRSDLPCLQEETPLDGCGLRLCETCEVRLRTEFDGSVDDLAAALEREPKAREEDGAIAAGKPRADVGFLRSEGLLMKWCVLSEGEATASGTGDVQMEGWPEA